MKSKLEKKKHRTLFSGLLFQACFLTLLLVSTGCGRKAFPAAPSSMAPDPPKKFNAILENGEIKVSWLLTNSENVRAINIYRSKIPKERFCATCPYTFEPVGSITTIEKVYREKAASGYHYAFKIEIEGRGGEVSSPIIVTVETP